MGEFVQWNVGRAAVLGFEDDRVCCLVQLQYGGVYGGPKEGAELVFREGEQG